MKKRVLFLASGGNSWMGGVYYIKNQIMQLLAYKPARKDVEIYLLVNKHNEKEYETLRKYYNVNIIRREVIENKLFCVLCKSICGEMDADILYMVLRYNISYIFPYFPKGNLNKCLMWKKSISWLPDFRQEHLPELYSQRELAAKKAEFLEVAKGHNKLVLSSKDAYKDYVETYGQYTDNIYIIPFCSMLDKKMVLQDKIEATKQKHGIKGEYFIICNQMWMHKNHLLAFKALKKAMAKDSTITIVCTGAMEDHRNRRYISDVKKYIAENELEHNIYLLGLLDKKEQIQLIKGAIALLQPSLFEGWGTGVEDAKTLGKRILMSDLSVHYEQQNENSIIFKRDDATELSKLLVKVWQEESGLKKRNMYSVKKAQEYGAMFYTMLCE